MVAIAMLAETAYQRRETLSDSELERLRAALAVEVARYLDAIQNYPPDRMEQYGKPHLARLEGRVAEVDRLLTNRRG
jgi:hypothetical protein